MSKSLASPNFVIGVRDGEFVRCRVLREQIACVDLDPALWSELFDYPDVKMVPLRDVDSGDDSEVRS